MQSPTFHRLRSPSPDLPPSSLELTPQKTGFVHNPAYQRLLEFVIQRACEFTKRWSAEHWEHVTKQRKHSPKQPAGPSGMACHQAKRKGGSASDAPPSKKPKCAAGEGWVGFSALIKQALRRGGGRATRDAIVEHAQRSFAGVTRKAVMDAIRKQGLAQNKKEVQGVVRTPHWTLCGDECVLAEGVEVARRSAGEQRQHLL